MSPRARALAEGERTYSTGSPCKEGHMAPRSTASRTCLECERANQRVAYAARKGDGYRPNSTRPRKWRVA